MTESRVAIVTGASRGIGFETARLLAQRGWSVGLTARGQAGLDTAVAQIGREHAVGIACDVADPASVQWAVNAIAERFGPIGAVVNNAGVIDPIGAIADIDPLAAMELFKINVGGVLAMCRAALPYMLKRKEGVIVNLSSGAAQNPVEGWSAYCTSKAGLAMLTRCLDLEYGGMGIRVHDFVPGVVGTDMLNGAQQKFDNAIARLDDGAKLTPDLPARCIAWLVDEGAGRAEGVGQSIRDPHLRKMVGLEERAQW
ncbi:SDR family oxidoreductase [Pelagibacterium sp.]|uniref:SDR family oxidoreductase n=1 Tax=Pelagibacterium sp. TaxID=1967288 RepID=UPI003BA9BD13